MKTVTIFGLRAILEAIQSGKSIDRVWLLKGIKSTLFEELLHVLRTNNIAFSFVPVERLNRFSDKNHQGAVAQISPVEFADLEKLIESSLELIFFILLGFQRINQSERVWLIHSQRNKFFVSCDSFATRSSVEVVVFGRGFREKDKNFCD